MCFICSALIFINRSDIINLEQLCIKPGVACWVLYVDIICLNYDGNVFDAALLALMSALQNLALPTGVVYDELTSTVKIIVDEDKMDEDEKVGLMINKIPLSVSFCVVDG